MTKKEAESLKEEIAKLREKVEALEKEPRKYEFHYHPPLFVHYPPVCPHPPWYQPLPWSGTLCGAIGGITTLPASGTGPFTAINRMEESPCLN